MKIEYTLKDFNKGKIVDKFGLQENGSSRLFMANTCFKRMVKYTPWETGTMATTVTVRPGSVTYEEDYAYYQYRGYTKGPVNKYSKKGTGKHWDKKMWNAEGHLVAREVSNYIKLNEKR